MDMGGGHDQSWPPPRLGAISEREIDLHNVPDRRDIRMR